jgi:hypothetical protein
LTIPFPRLGMFVWFIWIMTFSVVDSVKVLAQQSLQQLESMGQFERTLVAVDVIKQRKAVQCMMATGNTTRCKCLSQKLPVDTYLPVINSIVNQGDEGIDYVQLPTADRKVVDQCLNR